MGKHLKRRSNSPWPITIVEYLATGNWLSRSLLYEVRAMVKRKGKHLSLIDYRWKKRRVLLSSLGKNRKDISCRVLFSWKDCLIKGEIGRIACVHVVFIIRCLPRFLSYSNFHIRCYVTTRISRQFIEIYLYLWKKKDFIFCVKKFDEMLQRWCKRREWIEGIIVRNIIVIVNIEGNKFSKNNYFYSKNCEQDK